MIDDILKAIRVPTQVTRRPRSISKHLSYWKASEVRSWILYYSVPILQQFLPEAYYLHWCSFVLAFWLVLQPSISPAHLQLADRLLHFFYSKMATLYGLPLSPRSISSIWPIFFPFSHAQDLVIVP